MRRIRLAMAVAAIAMLAPHGVLAQSWPERPIKLIVPTGPGAATDVMARLLAEDVGRRLGGNMFVENRAGAAGLPAHQAAAAAEPDGYTLLFSNTSGMASNTVTFKKLPYDPLGDFTAVGMVANLGPQMVSVNAAVPAATLAELIAYTRANPDKATYGADATAGSAVFAGRLLNKRGAMGMKEVAYRSSAQSVQDTASGVLPILVSSIAVVAPLHQTGALRPIAVMSSRRFPSMPNVQAVKETLPGVEVDGWFLVVAPKGTPAPIVRRVNAAMDEFLKQPGIQQRLIDIGLATSGAGTPEATAEFIRIQQAEWRALAKELEIQPQ